MTSELAGMMVTILQHAVNRQCQFQRAAQNSVDASESSLFQRYGEMLQRMTARLNRFQAEHGTTNGQTAQPYSVSSWLQVLDSDCPDHPMVTVVNQLPSRIHANESAIEVIQLLAFVFRALEGTVLRQVTMSDGKVVVRFFGHALSLLPAEFEQVSAFFSGPISDNDIGFFSIDPKSTHAMQQLVALDFLCVAIKRLSVLADAPITVLPFDMQSPLLGDCPMFEVTLPYATNEHDAEAEPVGVSPSVMRHWLVDAEVELSLTHLVPLLVDFPLMVHRDPLSFLSRAAASSRALVNYISSYGADISRSIDERRGLVEKTLIYCPESLICDYPDDESYPNMTFIADEASIASYRAATKRVCALPHQEHLTIVCLDDEISCLNSVQTQFATYAEQHGVTIDCHLFSNAHVALAYVEQSAHIDFILVDRELAEQRQSGLDFMAMRPADKQHIPCALHTWHIDPCLDSRGHGFVDVIAKTSGGSLAGRVLRLLAEHQHLQRG